MVLDKNDDIIEIRNKRSLMLEEKVKKTPTQSRRRGSELKEAIYKAAINILENEGYEKVTFQNVAKEAKTTRSVLYRYWNDVFDLIFEAVRFNISQNPKWRGNVIDQEINKGSLRQDLIELLTFMRENFLLYPKGFLAFVSFMQSQGKNVLESTVGNVLPSNLIIMERLLARAQERGEAREKIGQSAKVLPFQMTRYHMLLEGQSMNDKQIKELVDEVLFPIYIKNTK